jgi:hypothetical protein
MERKTALAAAAAVVLTVSAGTAAVAANLGLLSSTADDTVGQLQPARDGEPPTETIVIEEIVPGPASANDHDGYEDDDRYEHDDDDDDGHDEDDEDDDGHDDDD